MSTSQQVATGDIALLKIFILSQPLSFHTGVKSEGSWIWCKSLLGLIHWQLLRKQQRLASEGVITSEQMISLAIKYAPKERLTESDLALIRDQISDFQSRTLPVCVVHLKGVDLYPPPSSPTWPSLQRRERAMVLCHETSGDGRQTTNTWWLQKHLVLLHNCVFVWVWLVHRGPLRRCRFVVSAWAGALRFTGRGESSPCPRAVDASLCKGTVIMQLLLCVHCKLSRSFCFGFSVFFFFFAGCPVLGSAGR